MFCKQEMCQKMAQRISTRNTSNRTGFYLTHHGSQLVIYKLELSKIETHKLFMLDRTLYIDVFIFKNFLFNPESPPPFYQNVHILNCVLFDFLRCADPSPLFGLFPLFGTFFNSDPSLRTSKLIQSFLMTGILHF